MIPAARHATLISPMTGKLLGGLVIASHDDGEVTIDFAGSLEIRGKPLSSDDIKRIERGKT